MPFVPNRTANQDNPNIGSAGNQYSNIFCIFWETTYASGSSTVVAGTAPFTIPPSVVVFGELLVTVWFACGSAYSAFAMIFFFMLMRPKGQLAPHLGFSQTHHLPELLADGHWKTAMNVVAEDAQRSKLRKRKSAGKFCGLSWCFDFEPRGHVVGSWTTDSHSGKKKILKEVPERQIARSDSVKSAASAAAAILC